MANNLNITHYKTKPLNVDVNFNPFNLDFSKIPINQNINQYKEMDYTDILKEDKFTFDDLTDIQYSWLASGTYTFITNIDAFKKGMQLSDVKIDGKNSEDLESFTNLTIEEVYKGKDGYNCFVVQDEAGNYMIINVATATPESGKTNTYYDMCYDLYPILVEIGAYETSWLTNMESKELLNLIGNAFGVEISSDLSFLGDRPLDEIKKIYFSQREQAEEISEKYYNKAKSENVELSFFGYSKGGGLSEYSYLRCAENEGSEDVLGDITLYNPLHEYKFSNDEIKTLKEADLMIYRNQGDFVSAIWNEHTLEDDENTTYIKCDWEGLYVEAKKPNTGNFQKNWASWLFAHENDIFQNIENVRLAVDGPPHQAGNYAKEAFNDDGSAVEVESYDQAEVAKYIFGTENWLEEAEEFLDKSSVTPNVASSLIRIGELFTHECPGNSKSMGEITYEYGTEVSRDAENYMNSIADDFDDLLINSSNNFDNGLGMGIFETLIEDVPTFAFNVTMSSVSGFIDFSCDTVEWAVDLSSNVYEHVSDGIEYIGDKISDGVDYFKSWF